VAKKRPNYFRQVIINCQIEMLTFPLVDGMGLVLEFMAEAFGSTVFTFLTSGITKVQCNLMFSNKTFKRQKNVLRPRFFGSWLELPTDCKLNCIARCMSSSSLGTDDPDAEAPLAKNSRDADAISASLNRRALWRSSSVL